MTTVRCRFGFAPKTLLLVALLWVLGTVPLPAQPAPTAPPPALVQPVPLGKEAYLTPPKEIVDAVLAARNENHALTNISPDGRKFVVPKTDGLPPLQRMACPCL